MSFRTIERLCVVLGVCAFLAGCSGAGDAPTTAPAKGTVTYNGKPVESLSVSFISDKGIVATGTTDAAGKFTMTTKQPGDGAQIGQHKVAIAFTSAEIEPMPGTPEADNYKKPVSPIPEKYGDMEKSGLTATVDKDASKNDFTFDLKD